MSTIDSTRSESNRSESSLTKSAGGAGDPRVSVKSMVLSVKEIVYM